MSKSLYLDELNQQQLEAVTSDPCNLLVLAGAGSSLIWFFVQVPSFFALFKARSHAIAIPTMYIIPYQWIFIAPIEKAIFLK